MLQVKVVGLCACVALSWSLMAAPVAVPDPHQQEQRFASSATTTLVEVVAFVSQRNGAPLPGLTRDDFRIDEDGVPQTITHFSFVDLSRSGEPSSGPPPTVVRSDVAGNETRTGRSYVIVLDSYHVAPLRSGTVKQLARKFIESYVEPGDAVAVVTLGGSGHQPFTDDKSRLSHAIETFVGGKSRSAALNTIDSAIRAATDGPAGDAETATKARNARTLFDSISSIARSFGAVAGRRRSIVLFSEGIELDLADTLGSNASSRGAAQTASTQASTYAADLLTSQRAMFDAARTGNVSLYTIDPRGTSMGEDNLMRAAGPPGRVGQTGAPTPPPTRDIQQEVQRSQGVLRNFAEETGGLALVNSSDFDRGFGRIADANSTYYVLGYSPSKPATDARYRRISVLVERPDVSVSARPGYFPVTTSPTLAPAPGPTLPLKGASPTMQALLTSALPVSGLGIRLAGATVGVRGQDPVVALIVELQSSGFGFIEEGDIIRNDIEVGFVAIDADGRIRAGRASTGSLRVPKAARAAVSAGLRYVLEIPLPPQRYQIRVGAYESGAGTAGSAVLDVDLTSRVDRQSGLVVGVHNDAMPTTGDYPMLKALLSAPPTTSRRFTADQRLSVFVPIEAMPTDGNAPSTVVGVVRRSDGTEAWRSGSTAVKAGAANNTTVHGAVVDVALSTLVPGPYSLAIEITTTGQTRAITPIAFTVIPKS